MPNPHPRSGQLRVYGPPVCTGVLGVLAATPGVHLFERWLAPLPAVIVSHGIAVTMLGVAIWQWRVRRAAESRRASRMTPAALYITRLSLFSVARAVDRVARVPRSYRAVRRNTPA